MNTFLFYDIETTGLNPAFDQILQFAAVRTDMGLNEIARHMVHIRLRPDVIPSPAAVITHGIRVRPSDAACSEYDAIRQIHGWLNEPGTISIGYNSLQFDDTFLRFSFYRNLLPAYTHQYAKGCLRMDLFPMLIAFWLYRPEVIEWPTVDEKPSFKLEHINNVNHLAAGRAHDALTDTKVTLALAKRLRADEKMWNYLSGYFHKTTDRLRANNLPVAVESRSGKHHSALMIGSEFGTRCLFQAPVLSIGSSIPYANQTLWLRLDLPELKQTTPDTMDRFTWVVRKRLGEPGLLLPPLPRYWKRLDPDRQALVRVNRHWLETHPDLFQAIVDYHRTYRYPPIPDLDADAALYDLGFLSPEARALCQKFHATDFEGKQNLVDRFSEKTLRELAARLLMRNYSSRLSGGLARQWRHFLKKINPVDADTAPVDYRGNRRNTPGQALAQIAHLRRSDTLSPASAELLDELADYVTTAFGC